MTVLSVDQLLSQTEGFKPSENYLQLSATCLLAAKDLPGGNMRAESLMLAQIYATYAVWQQLNELTERTP